jgi:putative tricarboxylic transport membrane protein
MRTADMVVALLLLGLSVLVAWESLRLDIGWGLNGPGGGFFPFWLAVGLGICGVVVLAQALWRAAPPLRGPLVQRGGWVPLLKVTLPAVALVALTEVLGLYLAAALYIGFSMRWMGRHHWLLVLALSIGLPLGSYFIFDKWFLIPMPRGWWAARFGL